MWVWEQNTVIKVYLRIEFDGDIDVSGVKSQIGLLSAECEGRQENSSGDAILPGYWSVDTGNIKSLLLEDVLEDLFELVVPCLDKIKSVIDAYGGKATFLIVTKLDLGIPILSFDRKFLEVVEYLGADVDIDMLADLVGVEYCTD